MSEQPSLRSNDPSGALNTDNLSNDNDFDMMDERMMMLGEEEEDDLAMAIEEPRGAPVFQKHTQLSENKPSKPTSTSHRHNFAHEKV